MCEEEQQSPSRRGILRWGAAAAAVPATPGLANLAWPASASATAGSAPATAARGGGAFYRAASGDTLRSIAGRFLGSEQRWSELYRLNQRVLGRGGEPRPGQQLALPESPDGAATRTFAPLPPGARPLPVPPEGYRLDRIGDALYAVTAGGTQAAFLVTSASAGVVVIDAPPALAEALPAAIRRVTGQKVTHLVYSHDHADHTANASAFGDVIRVAHTATAERIKANQDPGRPMPTVTFADRYRLDVGDQRLLLSYPGANHETGNILIHAPRQRAAMMVDVVMPGWAPIPAWGTADSVPGVLRAHDELAAMDLDTYIGGHVHRLGTREDIKISREFVHDLWRTTTNAIADTKMGPYFGKVEPGELPERYTSFRDFAPRAERAKPAIPAATAIRPAVR
ncbi:MBL fold metallo-hydrolase [Streptomyces sp. H10-C2]|uniref:MBL fold metallo-hydrolase n=1 Tax=Streptomyces sp. H10-C2 TaxID=3046210 RepID=UPI0024B8F902|nr:MBL fold metallo-hydrolase [Streptomyces sp. H10-C2]MDJ0371565.1 MBL fold metallo-hydrolase [Streptomyces sp. H10-C2]